jgi:hypothetical protein
MGLIQEHRLFAEYGAGHRYARDLLSIFDDLNGAPFEEKQPASL